MQAISKQSIQWLRMRRQVGQEGPVKVDEAKESLQFFFVSRLWCLQNSFNFTEGRSHAGLGDVSHAFYTRNQEHALLPLELYPLSFYPLTSILKSGQNVVQILHVVSVVNTDNEYIVQVNCDDPHAPEEIVHLSLKNGWCRSHAE